MPVVDAQEIDSPSNCSPVADCTPRGRPGTLKSPVASISDTIYCLLSALWLNLLARLRVAVELLILWPRITFLVLPRLAVSGITLVVTASWVFIPLAPKAIVEPLTTVAAWTLLACYLCAFSLQATWTTLRNVAVARRGHLTVREVLDSIRGNRVLEASS